MGQYTTEKELVWSYFEALDNAKATKVESVLSQFMSADFSYRGSYPFRTLASQSETATTFWMPLKTAISNMQRRVDVFIAGNNEFDDCVWVMGMGHFMGLFDQDILGIRHTNKLVSLRFAEFSCVQNGKITQTGLFVDWIGLMQQANMNPLPPSTAQYFVYPGPRKHNGLLFEDAIPEESVETLDLVKRMVNDLRALNQAGSMEPPSPEVLGRCWSENMVWYGPAGIGATYTIPRYIMQHTGPFRRGLGDKKSNGHVVRFAEGNFACFFGWPNLTNRAIGGWLGLPSGDTRADLQVVDVYCRDGDKPSENWVIIDIPYWLSQQGLDIFERTTSILNA